MGLMKIFAGSFPLNECKLELHQEFVILSKKLQLQVESDL